MPTANNQNQQNQKTDYDIFMEKGSEIPMNICALNQFISDKDMAIQITTFFKKVFLEYKGTNLYQNERNEIVANLYCSQTVNSGESTAKNALSLNVVDTNKGEWVDQLTNINATLNGTVKPFVLTNYAKDILGKIVNRDANGKVNWNRVLEYRDGNAAQNYFSGGNAREVILKVSNVNLPRLLERMYGRTRRVEHDTKHPDHHVSYDVRLAKVKPATVVQYTYNPVMGMVPEGNQEMILQVIQYDDYVMNEAGNMIGFNPKVSDIVMY